MWNVPTNANVSESICCVEIGQIWQKVEDQKPEVQMHCITEHIGFWSNCLDVWVLETAYYAFQQQPGADSHTGHAFVYLLITLPFSHKVNSGLHSYQLFLLSHVGNFVTLQPTDNSYVGIGVISAGM